MAKTIEESMVSVRIWKEGEVVKSSYDGVVNETDPTFKKNVSRALPDDDSAAVAAFALATADMTSKDLA